MICKNCGKEIVNDSGFCEYCGAKVKTTLNKKKLILWIVFSCIIFFTALFVGSRIYYNSDAYERNYVRNVYTIDIPNGIYEGFFDKVDRSFRYYDANTNEQILWIKGGNQFYGSCNSLSDMFDIWVSNRYAVPADKSKYTETTIHGIPAYYTMLSNSDVTGQYAVLYSEKSGGYIIICEYPTQKRDYYDEIMRNVIFSFREK